MYLSMDYLVIAGLISMMVAMGYEPRWSQSDVGLPIVPTL